LKSSQVCELRNHIESKPNIFSTLLDTQTLIDWFTNLILVVEAHQSHHSLEYHIRSHHLQRRLL